eukprot:GHVQ01041006.1.p1 GENE.GHVQ01041006.1~~GHVQ01041006.1.p1  ORF type:complete len:4271 (+),score=551.06 GHVQ01041006.1:762-13574(+)
MANREECSSGSPASLVRGTSRLSSSLTNTYTSSPSLANNHDGYDLDLGGSPVSSSAAPFSVIGETSQRSGNSDFPKSPRVAQRSSITRVCPPSGVFSCGYDPRRSEVGSSRNRVSSGTHCLRRQPSSDQRTAHYNRSSPQRSLMSSPGSCLVRESPQSASSPLGLASCCTKMTNTLVTSVGVEPYPYGENGTPASTLDRGTSCSALPQEDEDDRQNGELSPDASGSSEETETAREGSEAVMSEDTFVTKKRKRRKCGLGSKYSLFISCGIGGLFLIVFVPLLFCVFIPRIIRNVLNDSEIVLHRAQLSNPQDNQVSLSVSLIVNRNTGIKGSMDELPLVISWKDSAMGRVTLGPATVEGVHSEVTYDTNLIIDDMDAWDSFLVEIVSTGGTFWLMQGVATVRVFGLTFGNILFEKTIPIEGLPLLTQSAPLGISSSPFELLSLDMTQSTAEEVVVDAEVGYYNTGSSSIVPVGNVYMDLLYDGIYLGPFTAYNMSIAEGSNQAHFRGHISPMKALTHFPTFAKLSARKRTEVAMHRLLSRLVNNQGAALSAVGRRCSTGIYDAGVKALNVTTEFPGLTLSVADMVSHMDIRGIEIFDVPEDSSSLDFVSDVVLSILNPFGSPEAFSISEINVEGTMVATLDGNHDVSLGVVTAVLSTAEGHPRTTNSMTNTAERRLLATEQTNLFVRGNEMDLVFSMVGRLHLDNEGEVFTQFARNLISMSEVSVGLRDTRSRVVTRSAMGDIALEDVNVDQTASMRGFGGTPNFVLEGYEFTGTDSDGAWEFQADVSMTSVAPATVQLGDLSLELLYQKAHIGVLNCPNVTIKHGENSFRFLGRMDPSAADRQEASAFFSSAVGGGTTDSLVDMRILDEAETYKIFKNNSFVDSDGNGNKRLRWIDEALSSVTMSAVIPTLNNDFVEKVDMTDVKLNFAQKSPHGEFAIPFEGKLQILISPVLGPNIPIRIVSLQSDATLFVVVDGIDIPVGSIQMSSPVEEIEQDGENRSGGIHALVNVRTPLLLADEGRGFMAMSELFLQNPTVRAVFRGTASGLVESSLGELSIEGVPLETSIVLQGMHGLDNSRISKFEFTGLQNSLPPQTGALSSPQTLQQFMGVSLVAVLNNPSSTEFILGSMEVLISYKDAPVGRLVTMTDVTLRAGDTPVPLEGVLFLSPLTSQVVSTFLSAVMAGDMTDVNTTIKLVNSDKQWLSEALSQLKLSLDVPPLTELSSSLQELVRSTDFYGMHLTASGLTDVVLQGDIGIVLDSPLGADIPITILSTGLDISIYNEDGEVFIGSGFMPPVAPTSSRHKANSSELSLDVPVELALSLGKGGRNFGLLAYDYINKPTAVQTLYIQGTADISIDTPLGVLELRDFPIHQKIKLPLSPTTSRGGLSSAVSSTVRDVQFLGSHSDGGVRVEITVSVASRLFMAVSLPPMKFVIDFEGTSLGYVSADEGVTIPSEDDGESVELVLVGRVAEQQDAAGQAALTKLLSADSDTSGGMISVFPVLDQDANTAVWLREALRGLVLKMPFSSESFLMVDEMLEEMIVEDLFIDLTGDGTQLLLSGKLQAQIQNPFGGNTSFSLESVEFSGDLVSAASQEALGFVWTPLIKIPADQQQMTDGHGSLITHVAFDGVLDIVESPAFDEFAAELTQSDAAFVSMSGSARTVVRTPIGTLSVPDLSFERSFTFRGLGAWVNVQEQTVRVQSFRVLDLSQNVSKQATVSFAVEFDIGDSNGGRSDEGGARIKVGDVTLEMLIGDAVSGTLTARGLEIAPGVSSIRLDGALTESRSGEMLQLMSDILNSRAVQFTIVGASEQAGRPRWLSNAVAGVTVESSINGLESIQLQMIQDVSFPHLKLTTRDNDNIEIDGVIRARIHNPMGPHFNIALRSVSAETEISFEGNIAASLSLEERRPLYQAQDGDILSVEVGFSDVLHITDDFVELVRSLMHPAAESESIGVNSRVSITLDTELGEIHATGIEASVDTSLGGLGSISTEVLTARYIGRKDGVVELQVEIIVSTSPNVEVDVGDISMDLSYLDTHIGTLYVPHLALAPQIRGADTPQPISCLLRLREAQTSQQTQVLSQLFGYLLGGSFLAAHRSNEAPQTLTAEVKFPSTSDSPAWIQRTFEGMKIDIPLAKLAGLTDELVSSLDIAGLALESVADRPDVAAFNATLSATVRNVLGAEFDISVTSVAIDVALASATEAEKCGSLRTGTTSVRTSLSQNGDTTLEAVLSGELMFVDDGVPFARLLSNVFQEKDGGSPPKLLLTGNFSAMIDTPLGQLNLADIPLTRKIGLPPLLDSIALSVEDIEFSQPNPTGKDTSVIQKEATGGAAISGTVRVAGSSSTPTVQLDDVAAELFYMDRSGNEVLVGRATIPDFVLRPGSQVVQVIGELIIDDDNRQSVSNFIEAALSSGGASVTARGTHNSGSRSWRSSLVEAIEFRTTLKQYGSVDGLVQRVDIDSISLEVNDGSRIDDDVIGVECRVTMELTNPLGTDFPIDLLHLGFHAELGRIVTQDDNITAVAKATSIAFPPEQPVSSRIGFLSFPMERTREITVVSDTNGILTISATLQGQLEQLDTDLGGLLESFKATLNSNDDTTYPVMSFRLTGKAEAQVRIERLGLNLSMTSIPLDSTWEMPLRFDNAESVMPINAELLNLDLEGVGDDSDGGINVVAEIGLDNGTPLAIRTGMLSFGLWYKGVQVGLFSTVGDALYLEEKTTASQFVTGSLMKQTSDDALRKVGELLHHYLHLSYNTEISPMLDIAVDVERSNIPSWLKHALDGFSVAVAVPQITSEELDKTTRRLVTHVDTSQLILDMAKFQSHDDSSFSVGVRGRVAATVVNPFGSGIPFMVTSVLVNLSVTTDGASVGSMYSGRVAAQTANIEEDLLSVTAQINADFVLDEEGSRFASLAVGLLSGESVRILIEGKSTVLVNTSIGSFELNKVPFKRELAVEGMADVSGMSIRTLELGSSTPTDEMATVQEDDMAVVPRPPLQRKRTAMEPETDTSNDLHVRVVADMGAAVPLGVDMGGLHILLSAAEEPLTLFKGKSVVIRNAAESAGTSGLRSVNVGGRNHTEVELEGTLTAPREVGGVKSFESLVRSTLRRDSAVIRVQGEGLEGAPDWYNKIVEAINVTTDTSRILDPAVTFIRKTSTKSINLNVEDFDKVRLESLIEVEVFNPFGKNSGVVLKGLTANTAITNTSGQSLGTVLSLKFKPVDQREENDSMVVTIQWTALLQIPEDLSPYSSLLREIMDKDVVGVHLQGQIGFTVDTPLGTLTIPDLPLDTEIHMTGLGEGFGSAQVDTLQFTGPRGSDNNGKRGGVNIMTTLSLYMPTKLSMRLGAVVFDLMYRNTLIGSLQLPSLDVKPGANQLMIHGLLHPATADLGVASELFSKYVSSQEAMVTVKGVSASLTDGASPPWLQKLINEVQIGFLLPPADRILHESFSNMSLSNVKISSTAPSLLDRDNSLALSADVSATVSSPFGADSPIVVRQVALQVDLIRESPGPGLPAVQALPPLQFVRPAVPFSRSRSLQALENRTINEVLGSVHVTGLPAQHDSSNQRLRLKLRNTVMVFPDSGDNFSKMAMDALDSKLDLALSMVGTADVVVETDMGVLSLSGIPMSSPLGVKGMGLFERVEGDSGGSRKHRLVGGGQAVQDIAVEDADDSLLRALILRTSFVVPPLLDMSVELGTIMFNLAYDETNIGTVGIKDFSIQSGQNSVDVVGVLKPDNLSSFSRLVSRYLAKDAAIITLQGLNQGPHHSNHSVNYRGQDRGPQEIAMSLIANDGDVAAAHWVLLIMQRIQLDIPLNDGIENRSSSSTDILKSVNLSALNLDLSLSGNPTIAGDLSVQYKLPEQFHVAHQIIQLGLSLNLHASESSQPGAGKEYLGSVVAASLYPAYSFLDATTVDFHIEGTEIQVPPSAVPSLSRLASNILHSEGLSLLSIEGSASVQIQTPLGLLELSGVSVLMTETITHVGGIGNNFLQFGKIDVLSGDPDSLILRTDVSLNLPEALPITTNLGPVFLDLYYPVNPDTDLGNVEPSAEQLIQTHSTFGTIMQIGMVQFPYLTLDSQLPPDRDGGPAPLPLEIVLLRPVLDEDNYAIRTGVRTLLSNYINGVDTDLVVLGNENTSDSPFLQPALGAIAQQITIPGAQSRMMQRVELDVKISFIIPQIEARTVLENNLSVPLSIRYANMTTFKDGISMGDMIVDRSNEPDIAPPNSIHTSPPVRINPKLRGGAVQAFRSIIQSGGALVDAAGEMALSIDDYTIGLDVDMKGVPLTF